MVFEALRERLPCLGDGDAIEVPRFGLVAFSDDIELPAGGRAAVRVAATASGGGCRLDMRDSAALGPDSERFALDANAVRVASTIAIARALAVAPTHALADRIELVLEPSSFIGGGVGSDPGATAMAMARVFDAVSGALALAWPDRVGAGSCSLGAVVELRTADEWFVEALPGGEGATLTRAGRSAWRGPILDHGGASRWPAWLTIEEHSRVGSGGGGARVGGDGIVRAYRVARSVVAHVGIDRRGNPPHGLDRAGPPEPAELRVVALDGSASTAPAWVDVNVPVGHVLEVHTAGGAGHGFPGYGEIEWTPA